MTNGHAKPEEEKNEKLSILVLDDSDLIADLVTFAFRNHKAFITGATQGKYALQMLERQSFDLVITDLKMPGMSGMEFISKVRASPKFGTIPVIALSGYEDQFTPEKAKEAGADIYLKKPFTPEQLQSCVRTLLAKK